MPNIYIIVYFKTKYGLKTQCSIFIKLPIQLLGHIAQRVSWNFTRRRVKLSWSSKLTKGVSVQRPTHLLPPSLYVNMFTVTYTRID